LSYCPENSSGAICIGVPTIEPLDIMNKTKNIVFIRSYYSNQLITICIVLYVPTDIIASGLQKPRSVSLARLSEFNKIFFNLISLWTNPWECKNRIPSTTSRAT
jgi:hypothetical protein